MIIDTTAADAPIVDSLYVQADYGYTKDTYRIQADLEFVGRTNIEFTVRSNSAATVSVSSAGATFFGIFGGLDELCVDYITNLNGEVITIESDTEGYCQAQEIMAFLAFWNSNCRPETLEAYNEYLF